jgi:hypothetical protein
MVVALNMQIPRELSTPVFSPMLIQCRARFPAHTKTWNKLINQKLSAIYVFMFKKAAVSEINARTY